MRIDQARSMHAGAAPCAAPIALEELDGTAAAIITVMIASDRRALHKAWLSMLAGEPGIEIKGGPAMTANRLATFVEHHRPEVLLLDRALLDGLGPQSLLRIRAQSQHVRVLLLWDEMRQDLVADVLRNRFHGFLLTTCLPRVCLKAIRAVSEGELWLSRASMATAIDDLMGLSNPGDLRASADASGVDAYQTLTPREVQVVALVRQGCINKEIARELGIMEDTVKKHLQSVFAKLGVHRRTLVAMRGLPNYSVTDSIH